MRTWRVGTFSMGISLLFLGIFLLVSQFLKWDITTALKVWWPLILVVLGLEILLYLFSSKQEKPYLNFDLFSIIIVGILGTAGISIVFLQSSGLMEIVERGLTREEVTMELPTFDYAIKEDIKRIVIEADGQSNPVTIEGTKEQSVSLFGTYRTVSTSKDSLVEKPEDYLQAIQRGDTLYISLKEIPFRMSEFYADYSSVNATILVPTDINLEVVSLNNNLTLNPRSLQNNWSINNVPYLELNLGDTNNVKVAVEDTQINNTQSDEWKADVDSDSGDDELSNASLLKGEGNATIYVSNSGGINIINNNR